MRGFFLWACLLKIIFGAPGDSHVSDMILGSECPNGSRFRARSYTFYPDVDGIPMRTLQDFLENKASYVTLMLDSGVPIPRGTPICIPEFNRKYRRNIAFQYRGTNEELQGKKYSSCAICVRDMKSAHEIIVNQYITLIIPKVIVINETKQAVS